MQHKSKMNKGDRHERLKGNPSKRRGVPGGMSFSMQSSERNKVGKTTREITEDDDSIPHAVASETATSSASQISSVSTGMTDFAMNISNEGCSAVFGIAVREKLFPKIKFLQGTTKNDMSLDFSMDNTSICGFLCIECGVMEADAYNWWKEMRKNVKSIHTDYRNNRIKMIRKEFLGKCFQQNEMTLYYSGLTIVKLKI
jgi:hypothetical protein